MTSLGDQFRVVNTNEAQGRWRAENTGGLPPTLTGVAGVLLAGGLLTLASIIGVIMLFGIATHSMLSCHVRQPADTERIGVLDSLVRPRAALSL